MRDVSEAKRRRKEGDLVEFWNSEARVGRIVYFSRECGQQSSDVMTNEVECLFVKSMPILPPSHKHPK